ncbi:hypothetical protein KCP73_15260 [Salmonella enterica subsp. enterica]|nr:hypothetical protein KCP73_15260 [Salmonella enterica subsp. enterica]
MVFIPFQLATKCVDKLIRDGRVIRGYIGIGGRNRARARRSRVAAWTRFRALSLMK